MNLKNVEFYNVGAFENIPGFGENGLVRVPADVRNKLNERARFIGMDSVGVEIRFVTDAPNIDLYISMQKPEFAVRGSIRVFKGNFQYQVLEVEPGIVNFFRINSPINFPNANDKMLRSGGYSPDVWRIVCDRAIAIIHGINTHGHEIRPPKKEELPTINWLAYGSSITNSNLDGYPHFAASRLKIQVQNKGFSGACHIEKELVDYMLDGCSFDFMTCELGVNMRGAYTPQEFEERARYLIKRLVELEKPALIITTYPNSQTQEYTCNANNVTECESAYNDILVKLVKEANCQNIQLMHGYDVLTDVNGLSGDLIHPTAYGHAIMGYNLAERLKSFLAECGIEV